jgi:hypothetical protein
MNRSQVTEKDRQIMVGVLQRAMANQMMAQIGQQIQFVLTEDEKQAITRYGEFYQEKDKEVMRRFGVNV